MAIRRTKPVAPKPYGGGHPLPPPVERTYEEAWQRFDARARELLGIDGTEFVRRLERGEYRDKPEDERVLELGFMMVEPPA